jgi:hypothetical protein
VLAQLVRGDAEAVTITEVPIPGAKLEDTAKRNRL